MSSIGYIFFDNNALAAIHRRQLARAIAGSTRAAGLEPQATELNLIESYSAPDFISADLVRTLRALVGRDAALPWTGEILQLEALAFIKGERSRIPLNSIEILEPSESRDDLRTRLNTFRKRTDQSHRDLHAQARPKLQRILKERCIRPEWAELPAFLDAWNTLDVRDIFARRTWQDLDLPLPYRPEILHASESWRLLADADGVGLFQAALAFEQPRQVQRMDQLQLPYLGGADRRVLVTSDGPFAVAAKAVVHGRYDLARVFSLSEFLYNSGIDPLSPPV